MREIAIAGSRDEGFLGKPESACRALRLSAAGEVLEPPRIHASRKVPRRASQEREEVKMVQRREIKHVVLSDRPSSNQPTRAF